MVLGIHSPHSVISNCSARRFFADDFYRFLIKSTIRSTIPLTRQSCAIGIQTENTCQILSSEYIKTAQRKNINIAAPAAAKKILLSFLISIINP